MSDRPAVPEGWTTSNLGAVATLKKKKVDPRDQPGTTYLGLEHIEAKTMRILGRGTGSDVKSTKASFSAGDVLYGKLRPYLNKVTQPDFDGICSTDFLVLGESDVLDTGYLALFLNQAWIAEQAHHLSSGVELPRVSWSSLSLIPISYPSKAEQRRIAASISGARSALGVAGAHLTSARRGINQLRKAILVAGCSGRLTADWRRERDPSLSTGFPTLDPTERGLPDLPDSWVLTELGEVADVQLGGTPSRKTSDYWGGGIPWVSSGEVANCRIAETRETISESGLHGSSAKVYSEGTVLIAMIGEGKTRGQAAILDIAASTNQNAAGVIPDRRFVEPEYVWRWALAQYEVTRASGRGGNQSALNKQKVRELLIPVPSVEEQNEIVRRIDAMLAVVDRVRDRLDGAESLLEAIAEAARAKAFRGDFLAPKP